MSWTERLRQLVRRRGGDDAQKRARQIARAQQQAKIAAERARSESKYTPN